MNSTERVRRTIMGEAVDRQPIYGWVAANLTEEITEKWGSVETFEDKYEFDAAHIFGGPDPFNWNVINKLKAENEELTPDILLKADIFNSPENLEDYNNIKENIAFHKQRERFCYVQTPGFFEQFNGLFGIEEQLMYTALYPDELNELYQRQAEWSMRFADHCIELGADMIHISDDWGAQNNLMFSPAYWEENIYPNLKRVVEYVHSKGVFVSLHSDGCIKKVADRLVDVGLDLIHPWQESAGMSYELYLDKFADKFAILGGVCVQTVLGIVSRDRLEEEIRRVFSILRGKRWICCTTHFVQNHCSVEDLEFAYDLIYKLARE